MAKLERATVVAAYREIVGTISGGGVNDLASSALVGMSSDLLDNGYIVVLEGVDKGRTIKIVTLSADKLQLESALTSSAVGAAYYISPPADAASLRAYIRTRNVDVPSEATMLDTEYYTATLDKPASVVTRELAEFTFETLAYGASAVDSLTELDLLLLAGGFNQTVSASTQVNYIPHSDPDAAGRCTLRVWRDGTLYTARHCQTDFSFAWTAGEYCVWNWRVMGLWQAPVTDANPTPTYASGQQPIALQNIGFRIGTAFYPVGIKAFTYNQNNDLQVRDDATCDQGIYTIDITDRDPGGEMLIDLPTLGDYNPYTLRKAGTLQALQIVIGTEAGNIWTFDAPKMQIETLPQQIDQNYIKINVGIKFRADAGNDSVVFRSR